MMQRLKQQQMVITTRSRYKIAHGFMLDGRNVLRVKLNVKKSSNEAEEVKEHE